VNEFIDFLGQMLLTYMIGSWLLNQLLRYLIKKQIAEITDEVETKMTLDIEIINDQYFCYDHNTQAFVCQGVSMEELTQRFTQRYPGQLAIIHSTEQAVITKLSKEPELI
jgi:hypothetical protein